MKVLISGGGIGGFALARLLRDAGHDCLVIERAREFRPLGHFIALKAEGVAMLDRLGVRGDCEARAIPLSGRLRFRTQGGQLLRTEHMAALNAGLGGFLPMRRADLHDVLYLRVRNDVDVRFGTEVADFREEPGRVTVTLSDGREEWGDVLIGADGVHSKLRKRLFGESGERLLGGSYVAIDIEMAHGLEVGEISAYLGRGKMVGLLPSAPGRLSAIVYHGGESLRPKLQGAGSTRAFFAREYNAFAPVVRTAFAEIDDQSFVFVDDIKMICLDSIVRGRVGLLGDAAACPTFLSGMGSAFALQSAALLTEALCATSDAQDALAAYAARVQPIAARLQRNARWSGSMILGRNRALVAVRDSFLALTPRGWMMEGMRNFYGARREGVQAA
ncbi:NAD(P)/FAD-dependent oxidoreductase [Vitiosangium sp. GDMCC 1.1324]|uniref:FAD-dependent oxidoreductase n=1 Tax=Vitiosangium sp. (strain GDMCC 1.1324) TaxID=2138576 RepID=UPI00130DFB71|nr:NAD(P)/FAD-dependent oxidoreductase [Vitiosangium sp. GDMCC 1.1324]